MLPVHNINETICRNVIVYYIYIYMLLCGVFQFDWSFDAGEQSMDISVIAFPQAPPSILVLGKGAAVMNQGEGC